MSRPTRAVLLPTIGDPYRAGIWLSAYRKHMKNEIDNLYVCLNSNADKSITDHVADMYRKEGATVFLHYTHKGHGFPLVELIEGCKEDLVFLAEDDFYLLASEHMNRWFGMIERGEVDAVGSPRSCCSQEMIKKTIEVFSLTGLEAQSTNFWPCLYVGKREDLLRIKEREYGAYTHSAGTYISELDWTITKDEPGDVFVWASVQLRGLGLKFYAEDQGNWIDIIYRKQAMPWIHTGAGSSSFLNRLVTPDGRPIGRRDCDKIGVETLNDDGLLYVRETMQAFWELALQHFPIPSDSPAGWLNKDYSDALEYSKTAVKTLAGKIMRSSSIEEQKQFYRSTLAPILS